MGRGAGNRQQQVGQPRLELPIVCLPELVHIGTLDPADKGRWFSTSLEGHGLSVSRDPDEWERIAKLGGRPWWQLAKPDAAFVNVHELSTVQRQEISDWAVGAGYATHQKAFKLSYVSNDEDGEQHRFMLFADEVQARDEFEFLEEAESEPTLETVDTLAATELLEQRLGMKSSLVDIDDHLLVLWVDEQRSDLDGVWWEDDYQSLAAPRGVIVPRALASWQRRQLC